MLFSWTDGVPKTLNAVGSLAPELPVATTLEQKGTLRRNPGGGGMSRVVHSKWAITIDWVKAPEAVATAVRSMVKSGANVTLSDPSVGTYTLNLAAGDMAEGQTRMGLVSVAATFRQV
jgi:hypothetical protein